MKVCLGFEYKEDLKINKFFKYSFDLYFSIQLFFPSHIQISPLKNQMESLRSNNRDKDKKRTSNQIDKICSKLEISVKDIKNDNQLSRSVKQQIQKYIQTDDMRNLQSILDKKVLGYETEIGIKSMKWNIVHFAAKNNSSNILKVILTKTYQQSPQNYTRIINSKTFEGYTPLMISIIYSANDTFLLMLQFGGFDFATADNKGMTAYDLALNYKNEFAIKEIMCISKNKSLSINQSLLMKPLDPSQYTLNINCYSRMVNCFVDCFICFKPSINQDQDQYIQNPSDIEQNQPQQSFLRKSLNKSKLMSLLKQSNENSLLDIVKIGNKQIQAKYSIEWKKLSSAVNQKTALFDCFQPFDICQNNLIIANNLIIFQSLSDHTWLVRKIVKPIKKSQVASSSNNLNSDGANLYSIQTYLNDEPKKITVDEYIPFLKERQEPMFLSNLNQMWPQILQKGLAKIYGSYMKLSQLKPMNFIENLTGNFTKQFELVEGMNCLKQVNGQFIKQKQIMASLQDFMAKGYLMLLEGRSGTSLSPKNSPSAFKNYCYTILNFYQKGNKRLILVNCPYVLNSWKEKQKTQIMQLKLIKSHYNSHNQMCVWIDENQFAHFFKSIIISFTEPNLVRNQLKIRYLLQNQIGIQEERKLSVFQNITNSVKSIFSDRNDKKRQLKTSTVEAIPNQKVEQGSQTSIASAKIKGKKISKLVYVKFKIEASKNSEYITLAVKDNVSHSYCKINKFLGWVDGGSKDISLEEENSFCTDMIKIKQKKGEYLCLFDIDFYLYPGVRQNTLSTGQNKENQSQQINSSRIFDKQDKAKSTRKHQLLVICWSEDVIQLEHIEEQFGIIDSSEGWRKNCIKNWLFIDKKSSISIENESPSMKYVSEKIANRVILMTKSSKDVQINVSLTFKNEKRNQLQKMIQEGTLKKLEQNSQKQGQNKEFAQFLISAQCVRDPQHSEFQYIVFGGSQQMIHMLQEANFTISPGK